MDDISHLLNNAVINKLADIYLDFLSLSKQSIKYRRLKNAVILFALLGGDMSSVCKRLSEIDDISAELIQAELTTIADTENMRNLFNAAYCNGRDADFMPIYKKPSDCIAFLGITFLYILETNYPEYRI